MEAEAERPAVRVVLCQAGAAPRGVALAAGRPALGQLRDAAGGGDVFFTAGGRPVRDGAEARELGLRPGHVVQCHARLRGGMDTIVIVLIAVGSVLGLVALYYILPKVVACLGWLWRNVVGPPLIFVYDYLLTPVGHCMRDSIFTCKEACCDCCDACEMCCSPYKRI